MAEQITINSISEYVQYVCSRNNAERNKNCIRDYVLLFRGHANKDYELMPAIGRNRHYETQYTILNDERNLIEMAKYRLPDIFRSDLLPIELLALLQHYGIPTRLLDVTENALVALYFACCNEPDIDGEVIVFCNDNSDVVNYPIINAIADSYRFTQSTWTHLSLFFGNVKNQPYFLEQKQTSELYNKVNLSNENWIKECCSTLFFVYAPIRSTRQQVQHGRYILFPNAIEDIDGHDCFTKHLKSIPKDHEEIDSRIIIPKEFKKQIINDLAILGITKAFLFCDSIDTVCEGILDSFKRRY